MGVQAFIGGTLLAVIEGVSLLLTKNQQKKQMEEQKIYLERMVSGPQSSGAGAGAGAGMASAIPGASTFQGSPYSDELIVADDGDDFDD